MFDGELVCERHHNQVRTWLRLKKLGQKGEADTPLLRDGVGALVENPAYDQRLAINHGGGKRLNPAAVREIRNLHGKVPVVQLAKQYRVDVVTIYRAVAKKTWAHV